ncbi:4Fe-4S cluster-binding domain-containing protein [Novilysobacter spongiicola]|uniref:Anaerobic ribonucleoside-triphosphate reductase activating protein n=1 Tax=Lysobacter spongiicola DSM 21749 TaxID=1122188 RepID=A0A1T4SJQ0_9GAMM|nr:4Fe-4S cluster-binding domain-containing protein [Lysobacter spongiicola]SKA28395.1 anaerobic ribonucleoside-triphosphate reductase activating protein [Lysobacter spongiicola DSM 21749]
MNIKLDLSRVHFPVTTLGPGRRLGIWFQGCSIQCPGCISADTWGSGRHLTTVGELLEQVQPWLDHADGITVTGGEPFDQPEALLELLVALRRQRHIDILVYSGHPLERLTAFLDRAEGLIDALISDPFENQQPQSIALRGSDNQRLNLLTALGRERFTAFERPLRAGDQVLDLMLDDDGSVWMAGIPRRDDLLRLRDLLRDQGHRLQVSADTAYRDARGTTRS